MNNLGEQVARRKWGDNLSWTEVEEEFGLSRESLRSAARRWKKAHPEEYQALKQQNTRLDDGEMPEPGIFDDQGENERVVYAIHPQIKAEEDLIAYCNIDLTVWYIHSTDVRSYQTPIKRELKRLLYQDGRIVAGNIDKGGVYQFQQIYIRLVLRRRDPEPVHPILRPIEAPELIFRSPERVCGDNVVRQLTFADSQMGFRKNLITGALEPFHDRVALDLVAQIAVAAGVERIDVLGDFLDFTQATRKFMQEPAFYGTTQPAVLEGHWFLRRLREQTGAAVNLFEGNHCVRVKTFLMELMPWAYGLTSADDVDWPALSVPRLLGLDGLGVAWIDGYPNGESWLGKRVCFRHGNVVRKGSGRTAAALADESDVTLVVGHVHRDEEATRTVWLRDRYRYVKVRVVGCTCRVTGEVPGATDRENWQQSLLITDYDLERDRFSMQPVMLDQGIAVWDGKVFEGQDYVEELREAWPRWNW